MSDNNFEGFTLVHFGTGNTAMGWFVCYYKTETNEILIITCEGNYEIFPEEYKNCESLVVAWHLCGDVWQIPDFEPKTCLAWVCFLIQKKELQPPSESEKKNYANPNETLQKVLKSVAQRKQQEQQEVTSPLSILNAPAIRSVRETKIKNNSVCKVLRFNNGNLNV